MSLLRGGKTGLATLLLSGGGSTELGDARRNHARAALSWRLWSGWYDVVSDATVERGRSRDAVLRSCLCRVHALPVRGL